MRSENKGQRTKEQQHGSTKTEHAQYDDDD